MHQFKSCHATVIPAVCNFFGGRNCKSRMGGPNVREVCKRYRRLQLLLQIFNECHSSIIFLIKIYCLTAEVAFTYFGVRYFNDNRTTSMYNIILALYAILSYVIVYDRAFDITLHVKISHLKSELLATTIPLSRLFRFVPARKDVGRNRLLRRSIRSFPTVGIQIRPFGVMERSSTPEFLNFVIEKTATLLVTF